MGWAALRLLLLAPLVAPATQHRARPPPKFPPQLPTTTVQASVASTLRDVPNAFDSIIIWGGKEVEWGVLGQPALNGSDSRAADYPFLKYVQIFTATGGCYASYGMCDKSQGDRDRFNNNSDPSSGLNTTEWIAQLRGILVNGYLPQVVVANVPIALSDPPKFGAFGVNSAHPANYSAYQGYVRGLAAAAVEAFGVASVRRWRWTVFTEFNNYDWLQGSNASFMRLYDHTVCGLREAIGRENLSVGAHGCLMCEDDHTHYGPPLNRWGYNWDPRDLLDHVKRNVSACDPDGTQLNYISTSFCKSSTLPVRLLRKPERSCCTDEQAVGSPGDLSAFDVHAAGFRTHAEQIGLDVDSMFFGIDEGRILGGPDGGNVNSHAIGTSWQGSWDALYFHKMAYSGLAYYSRWDLNTGPGFLAPELAQAGANQTADNVACNLARLAWRMAGDRLLAVTTAAPARPAPAAAFNITSGKWNGVPSSILNATLSLDEKNHTLRVLAFHHHPFFNATKFVAPERLEVSVCGLETQFGGGIVSVGGQAWKLDDTHAQFWPAWEDDMLMAGINTSIPGISWYEDAGGPWDPAQDTGAFHLWMSNVGRYRELARLEAEAVSARVNAGCLRVAVGLEAHSVVLLEYQLRPP